MKASRILALLSAAALLAVVVGVWVASEPTVKARGSDSLPTVSYASISPMIRRAKPAFIYFCESSKTLCDRQSAEIARLASQYPDMTFLRCNDPGEKAFAMLVIPNKIFIYWHDQPEHADIKQIINEARSEIDSYAH